MLKNLAKKKIKQASVELVKELLEVLTTAEYAVTKDPDTGNTTFKVKLNKEF